MKKLFSITHITQNLFWNVPKGDLHRKSVCDNLKLKQVILNDLPASIQAGVKNPEKNWIFRSAQHDIRLLIVQTRKTISNFQQWHRFPFVSTIHGFRLFRQTSFRNDFISFFFFIFLAVINFGCFDLDNSLFNNQKLSSYNLRTTVIPEAKREEVVLISQNKKIYGYFVKKPDSSNSKQIILYNHGNKDHLQFYWDRVELFYKMGYNVFIYDYQGYGMSEGEPTEDALYSDATAAYNYVSQTQGFKDVLIVVYGFSLGGAPATYLSANVFTPKALILESVFASSSTLTQSATLLDFPSSYIMKGEYNNAEKIKRVTAPLLMFHGTDDKFIDMEKNGKIVFRNANEPKQFKPVPGADHSNVPSTMGENVYISIVRDFILKAP